jgi:hypothetical protein
MLVGPVARRVVGIALRDAFLLRIPVHLVGLQDTVLQRQSLPIPRGCVLEAVPEVEPLGAVGSESAGQSGGGGARGDATHDQDQFTGAASEAVEDRAGDGVEDSAAAEIEDRGALATVDRRAVVHRTARAGQPRGVQPLDQLGGARVLVPQVGDRDAPGCLLGPGETAGHPRGSTREIVAVNHLPTSCPA